ncbi:MAG: tetratricopeptide repeat protein [Betaproteobacteria bacterium]|nr:tetratricopeptide repeat protein [Betaproteobacteria bacterium]
MTQSPADEGERELRAGNFAAAEKLLAGAAKADPRSARVQHLLGVAVHEQGKLDRAIACYRRAVDLDAGLADVRRDLGDAYMARRRYGDALACYREAMRQDASDDLACMGVGSALREMGDLVAARKQFQLALWLKIRRRLRAPWVAMRRLFSRKPV